MAKKAIKKTTAKPAKKTVAKPVAKKTVTKRTARKPAQKIAAPVVEKTSCACGDACHCCCCRGHRFVRFGIKVILICIVFMCGMAVAPLFMHNAPGHHPMQFDDNGCVILESVTCPKMLEVIATADTDANGCVTHDEIRAAKHQMHHTESATDAE